MTTSRKACADQLRRLAEMIEDDRYRPNKFTMNARPKTVRYMDGAVFKVGTSYVVEFELDHDAHGWI